MQMFRRILGTALAVLIVAPAAWAQQTHVINQRALDQYHHRFQSWSGNIVAFCRKHGIVYQRAPTDRPLEDLLFRDLRAQGFVK